MNIEVSGPNISKKYALRTYLLQWIRPCSAKTMRYFWISVCVLLAVVAIFNYNQARKIQENMIKQRLIEVSVQDLIMQSTALRHLDSSHTYETKLGLESSGYSSPQELINQLSARLAVIEAINEPTQLLDHANALRTQLAAIDQQVNSPRTLQLKSIDPWFIELNRLNKTMKSGVLASDERIRTLQCNHLTLTLIILFFSIGFVSLALWRGSTLQQRLSNQLLQFKNQSQTDELTGLLNQQGWQDLTDAYLQEMQQKQHLVSSIAMINIDYFKQYNDTFGHEAGNVRLREFAENLRKNFRPGDLIARISGEEFAVLLPNCTADDAKRIVDRIRSSGSCKVSFSAGICNVTQTLNIDHTMAMADQALYQAKNQGRNRSHLEQS